MKYNKSITATVYVINDGKVLLHQHKKYNTWFPLGGHIEENEFPHEAAIREVKEESGFDVKLMDTELAPHIELARVRRIPSPFCLLHEGIGGEENFFDFIYIAPKKLFLIPIIMRVRISSGLRMMSCIIARLKLM